MKTEPRVLNANEQEVLEIVRKKVQETVDKSTEPLQKQMDAIFERTDRLNIPTGDLRHNTKARGETRDWLVKFFKGKEPIETEQKAFSSYQATSPDGDGGYLVPELLQQEIAHAVLESGVARQRMRYMPFSGPGNTRRLPTEASGVSVSWVDEAGSKPITSITIDQVVQSLEKLAAIGVVTESLLEDSAVDLVAYISRRIGEAIAVEEDRVFFSGSIAGGDPFNGVINAAGVTTSQMTAGNLMEDVTADDLLSAIYAIPKEGRSGAAFYFHSDILFKLQQLRADGATGEYLIQKPIAGGEPNRLWGYPVYTVDNLPSLDEDGADTPFGIFANLQKTCVYGDKAGVRVKILTEATLTDGSSNTVSLAQQDLVGIRVFKRVGYAVLQPSYVSVLTTGLST